MQRGRLVHFAHLHFLVFIAGFTAVLGKLISIEALPLVWYRMGIATLLIYGFVYIRKINLRFSKRAIASFGLVGFVIAIHWVIFFWAIKVSNVSITLAVLSSGAFFASAQINATNEVAIGFFLSLGFKEIARGTTFCKS